jgi:oligosaccharide repeat unit polymerase
MRSSERQTYPSHRGLAVDSVILGLFALAFASVWLISYLVNRDLFSPIKLYLLTIFICFFDIFVNPYRLEIRCVYLGLLLIPLVLCKYESASSSRFAVLVSRRLRKPRAAARSRTGMVRLIWILTVIPVASMVYLITYFGGIANYLSQLAIRHLAFQGLNTFVEVAMNLVSLLTVLYFGIGVTEKRRRSWWILYGLHFGIAFAILSMSGSRRSLLMPLVMMLALFHYFRSAISARRAGVFLASVLVLTSAIGVLRLGQRGTDLGRDLTDVEQESVTAHFKYGLVPLEIIFGVNNLNLRYGSTFVAAITNVIPRPLWPDKPDSAGLAITRDYLGDRWLGASNLNAGFLVESIMNFGFPIGLTFSFIGLTAAMVFLIHRYHLTIGFALRDDRSVRTVFYAVRYLQIAVAITGLTTWETAVISVPLILNLSALWIIEIFAHSGERSPGPVLMPVAASTHR